MNKLWVKILIGLVIFLIVALAGYAAFIYIFTSEETEEVSEKRDLGPIYSMDEITTNLADTNQRRLIQVKIELEVSDKKTLTELEELKTPVAHAVLLVLRSKTYDELNGSAGMEMLAKDIKEKINEILTQGEVVNVYFPRLIIQ